jgi:DNA-binding GntR family transcriptional regulator
MGLSRTVPLCAIGVKNVVYHQTPHETLVAGPASAATSADAPARIHCCGEVTQTGRGRADRAERPARDGGITIASLPSSKGAPGRLDTSSLRLGVLPIEASLTSRAYDALREAIAEMPIYDGTDDDIRLDERALAERLGISRTPVRAALQRLETEGVVQTIPRRGIYVVRKTKAEIIEVILASAALEGMAARLAAERASDGEIEAVLNRFPAFRPGAGAPVSADAISEYSADNLEFHQRIADLAHSELFSGQIARLKIHMRAIRQRTIGDDDRRARSAAEHAAIMAALRDRDADRAEALVRRHAVSLAEHVRDSASYLR